MNVEIENLFDEILKKYEKAESKNNDKLLDVELGSYQRAEHSLEEEIEWYKTRLKELLK